MKRVNPMAYMAASAALAAVVLAGCARAESQTAVTNQAVVSPPFTNAAMNNFQKPPAAELKQKLTPMQFEVTQHAATEPAFRNEFWDSHQPGIYVDIVSGRAAVQFAGQVRLGLRLAELLAAAGEQASR